MSQESQGTDPAAMENAPVKRKRGRPRKDENLTHREPASASPPVIDIVRRNQRPRIDQTTDAMVGQVVSGVLEGSFDAGYLLAVKVGNTNTVLKGVVFEPGLSVPISAANDVAPHVKMFKRNEIPLPMMELPTQVSGPNLQSEQNNERVVKVSGNEDALPLKVSPPVKQVPRASPLSPSQVQINTLASSMGEINDVSRVPKTATHALQLEDCKTKSSPSLPAKGLAGEASGDASHAVVSLQPTASQTKSRMPTDVMQKDKPGLPSREPEGLPVDASQVVQVYTQTAVSQIGERKSIDLLSNAKSEPPASEHEEVPSDINQVIHVPLQAAASHTEAAKSEPSASEPEGVPSDINHVIDEPPTSEPEGVLSDMNRVIHVPLQAAASQTEGDKSEPPTSKPEGVPSDINLVIHVPLQAAVSQTEAAKSEPPAIEPEGVLSDINCVIHVPLQAAASQTEAAKSEPPTSEPEGVSSDINCVIHVPLQAAASQTEADRSEPPASEPEGVPSDINRVIHVPLQAAASQTEARKSTTNVLPNKFDLPQREPEGPLADARQVIEDSLQGAASQIEYRKSTSVLPDDKVDQRTPELHASNQVSLNKLEQVVQPKPKGELSATQPSQLEHDRAVEPGESLQKNEAAAQIRGTLNNTNTPEDSKFIPPTEPSVEKLSGSETMDQPTQGQQHMMIFELQPGQCADDTMDCANVNLNYFPVSDAPQPVVPQTDNEVTTLLENKASPKGNTPQDLAPKLSDVIPIRDEFSHLNGGPIAEPCELTEGHAMSEPQTSQPLDMLQRGSLAAQHMEAVHAATGSVLQEEGPQPQLSNPAISMQNEDGISKDASLQLQMLEMKTTPTACDSGAEQVTAQSILTKEVSQPQFSKSVLSMQNQDSISNDAIPSEQSQMLQKGTTPAVSLDFGTLPDTTQSVLPKEVPEHQISNPTLPTQNEDSVSMDGIPSVKSQSDPKASTNTNIMGA